MTQTLNLSIKEKEERKFRLDTAGNVALNITSGLGIGSYDYVSVTYPNSSREVYVFKTNGSSGTIIATITINYTDSTKDRISDVTRT